MFACLVSLTWLFGLKVSSRGFALYFQDNVSGGTLLYEVFTPNRASIWGNTWIGIDTAVFIPLSYSVIERDI